MLVNVFKKYFYSFIFTLYIIYIFSGIFLWLCFLLRSTLPISGGAFWDFFTKSLSDTILGKSIDIHSYNL